MNRILSDIQDLQAIHLPPSGYIRLLAEAHFIQLNKIPTGFYYQGRAGKGISWQWLDTQLLLYPKGEGDLEIMLGRRRCNRKSYIQYLRENSSATDKIPVTFDLHYQFRDLPIN